MSESDHRRFSYWNFLKSLRRAKNPCQIGGCWFRPEYPEGKKSCTTVFDAGQRKMEQVNLRVSVRCMSWHRLTSQCPQTAETIGKSSSPRSPEKATPKKSLLVWWRPSWLQNMLMMIVLLAIKDPSLKRKTWHYGMPLQNVQDIKFEQ